MSYDWSECVMSVLGTTKHSLSKQCIDTWQQSYIVLSSNRVMVISYRVQIFLQNKNSM